MSTKTDSHQPNQPAAPTSDPKAPAAKPKSAPAKVSPPTFDPNAATTLPHSYALPGSAKRVCHHQRFEGGVACYSATGKLRGVITNEQAEQAEQAVAKRVADRQAAAEQDRLATERARLVRAQKSGDTAMVERCERILSK